ncbi:hypothetical protein ABW20_dc0103495 [Dactylellina cionopaga]|nr:hypothetical protein ABW20_dc0103495 [Dactylellina cionopaga]
MSKLTNTDFATGDVDNIKKISKHFVQAASEKTSDARQKSKGDTRQAARKHEHTVIPAEYPQGTEILVYGTIEPGQGDRAAHEAKPREKPVTALVNELVQSKHHMLPTLASRHRALAAGQAGTTTTTSQEIKKRRYYDAKETLDKVCAKKRKQNAPVEKTESIKYRKYNNNNNNKLDSVVKDIKTASTGSRVEAVQKALKAKGGTGFERVIKPILKKTSTFYNLIHNPDPLKCHIDSELTDRVANNGAEPQARELTACHTFRASEATKLAAGNPGEQFVFDIGDKSQFGVTSLASTSFNPETSRVKNSFSRRSPDGYGIKNEKEVKGARVEEDLGYEFENDDFGYLLDDNRGATFRNVQEIRERAGKPISRLPRFKRIGTSNCLELVDEGGDYASSSIGRGTVKAYQDDTSINESEIIRHPVSGNPMTKKTINQIRGELPSSGYPVTPKTPKRKEVSLKDLTSSTGKSASCHGLFRTPKTVHRKSEEIGPPSLRKPKFAGMVKSPFLEGFGDSGIGGWEIGANIGCNPIAGSRNTMRNTYGI